MANWTGPNPNRLLPGEPWASDLALAAFEDPVAIAEGAAGAPRVAGKALGGLGLGVLVTGSGTLTGLGDYKEIHVSGGVEFRKGNLQDGVEIRFSADGGATWGSWQFIVEIPGDSENPRGQGNLTFSLDLETGDILASQLWGVAFSGSASYKNETSLTVPANCDAIQIKNDRGFFALHAMATGGRP